MTTKGRAATRTGYGSLGLVTVAMATVLAQACGGGSPMAPTGVTVPVLRAISVDRFVAFGDSITAGEIAAPQSLLREVVPATSYPTDLRTLLRAEYPGAGITVQNAGLSGERAVDGVQRLPGVLDADQPQCVLILEGSNDINVGQAEAVPSVIGALDTMITVARRRQVAVLIGTVPPQVTGEYRAYAPEVVAALNAAIKDLGARAQVPVVDVYAAIAADLAQNMGPDGLHPSAAGYEAIARAWQQQIDTSFGRD